MVHGFSVSLSLVSARARTFVFPSSVISLSVSSRCPCLRDTVSPRPSSLLAPYLGVVTDDDAGGGGGGGGRVRTVVVVV